MSILIDQVNDSALRARLAGGAVDRARASGLEVKAVTWHAAQVWEERGRWRAQAILDV